MEDLSLSTLKDAINKRHSSRTFDGSGITTEQKLMLADFSKSAIERCGASSARIAIVDSDAEVSRMSTYGFIKGAKTYMVLISSDTSRHAQTRAAAAMEMCVLKATADGLGTCWIGGTFKRSDFATASALRQGEEILAIVPVGVAARPRFGERIMQAVARSTSRKDAETLFFDRMPGRPLPATSPYAGLLEYVRLAPSSTNSQPWRTVVDGEDVAFYAAADNSYTPLDMGIAMLHFAVAVAPRRLTWIPAGSITSFPRLISYAACRIE